MTARKTAAPKPEPVERHRLHPLELIRDMRLYLLIVAAAALVSVVQSHQAHNDTRKTLTNQNQTLNLIRGCLTPGDSCAKQAAAGQASLLNSLHQFETYTDICTVRLALYRPHPPTLKAVNACVLKMAQNAPPPAVKPSVSPSPSPTSTG